MTYVMFVKPESLLEWLRLFFIGLFVSIFLCPLFMRWLSIESAEATSVGRFAGGFLGNQVARVAYVWMKKKEKEPPPPGNPFNP